MDRIKIKMVPYIEQFILKADEWEVNKWWAENGMELKRVRSVRSLSGDTESLLYDIEEGEFGEVPDYTTDRALRCVIEGRVQRACEDQPQTWFWYCHEIGNCAHAKTPEASVSYALNANKDDNRKCILAAARAMGLEYIPEASVPE